MKYRFKGLNEYVDKLVALSNAFNADVCIENAVTKGSEVVAEYTVKELENLPVDNTPGRIEQRKGIRSIQKAFLIKSFGVTPLDRKGSFINRKTGVDKGVLTYDGGGYTPAVVLARTLERGTSFLPKNPVFSRASRKARTPCLEAMQESLNEDIARITVNNAKRLKRRELNG